jgi:hypothetical protein
MFFTIEPMINLGRPQVKILSDGWTAVTRDRSLSAQFEHTVGVTERAARSSRCRPPGCTRRPSDRLRPGAGGMATRGARGFRDVAATPDHLGHRSRLRERFMTGGAAALPDYELLELVLYRAFPRGDVKPLAKA